MLRIESDLDSELCLTTQYVFLLYLYSFLAIRKYEFLSKGPEGPTWKNSGLQKSEPEGFSLGSTQGGRLASQSLVHWGLPVRGLDWAKANFRTMNGGSITLGLNLEGQGGH